MNHFNYNALAAVDLLESWGIDAYEVLRDGISLDGYLVRQKDAFGRTALSEDGLSIMTDWVDWPAGFPVDTFLEHVQKWREAES
jgi:hypothetical protein